MKPKKSESDWHDEKKLRMQISGYHNQVIGMIGDINYASAIVNEPSRLDELAKGRLEIKEAPTPFELLWNGLLADKNIPSFSNQLLSSVKKKRQEIEKYAESIQIKSKSRRKFLRKAAIGGIAVAAAAQFGDWPGKRKEENMIPSKGRDIELLFMEPNFGTMHIPEVNKTIYTEGKYKDAKYIVVIPHSTELNAIEAARKAGKGPITYVAGNRDRNLKIKIKKRIYEIYPNNAFCVPGLVRCFDKLNGKWDKLGKESQNYAIQSVQKFVDEMSNRIFAGKMVMALHQNTNQSSTKINK